MPVRFVGLDVFDDRGRESGVVARGWAAGEPAGKDKIRRDTRAAFEDRDADAGAIEAST